MKKPSKQKNHTMKPDEARAMAGLIGQIRTPGDGVYALSTIPTKSQKDLVQLIETTNISHGKFVEVLKQVADASGLDLTVKTVLLIKPSKKAKAKGDS